MRSRWLVFTIVGAVGGSLLAACSSNGHTVFTPTTAKVANTTSTAVTAATPLPNTPAGAQARWLVGALAHLPIADTDVRAHFDAAFLAQVSPAALNQVLPAAADARVVSISVSSPNALVAIVSVAGQKQVRLELAVDAKGLISGLLLRPVVNTPVPTSWHAVDAALRSVAPKVRLFVGEVTGDTCTALHAIDPDASAPLGSAFKLYVLDALGRTVESHQVSWDQQLTITDQFKSLPSGDLRNEPDGTRISVRDVAAKMISISDNTAADMLIQLLGRSSIEAARAATGMTDPARGLPFLATRELFTLKLDQWPTLADRYVAADTAGRRALLSNTVDPMPLPTLAAAAGWTTPRAIDSLEWFASAHDVCRVYASLAALARRPGLTPISDVLEINDGGLALDASKWKTTWFKGGSEPGLLTLNYLATTRTGRSYVVSALAENPSAAIDETAAAPTMLSAIKGAFTLAAQP